MLSPTVRSECFEPIARGHSKIAERPRLIQKTKLSKRDVLDISRQFSAPTAGPDQFRFGIGEALIIHKYNVMRYSWQPRASLVTPNF